MPGSRVYGSDEMRLGEVPFEGKLENDYPQLSIDLN